MSKLFIFILYKLINIMSNNGNFDLSGVFHVQKNYLTDLSNSYPDVNNAPTVVKYVLDLQNKTKDIESGYESANTSANAVLTQQNDMIDIVNKEQERLSKSKDIIDQNVTSEDRQILLTNSNRLLYEEYTKIILCVVAGLTIYIALVFGVKLFFPISGSDSTGYVLLHILNIIVWMIIILKIYMKIQSRSQINFNEINLPPPKLTDESNVSTSSADYNNLFKDLGLCYSEHCCGEGTVWDEQLGSCVNITDKLLTSPAEGFSDTCGCSEEPEIKELSNNENDSCSVCSGKSKTTELSNNENDSCSVCSGKSKTTELSNENVLNKPANLSFSNIEQAYQNDTPYSDLDKSSNQNETGYNNNQYIGMNFNDSKFSDFIPTKM
jgi:hypothetical protein